MVIVSIASATKTSSRRLRAFPACDQPGPPLFSHGTTDTLGKQSWTKKSGKHLAFFEVLGKVLRYFGSIVVDFWGYFPFFYAILHYFTLFYAISRYCTLSLIFDSMISYLRHYCACASDAIATTAWLV